MTRLGQTNPGEGSLDIATLLLLARQGDPAAQFRLAMAYLRADGVDQNAEEMLRWATAAANQGNAEAMYLLAAQYAGDGVLPRDLGQSEKWLKMAANQGMPEALVTLARGLPGLAEGNPRAEAEALRLLRAAADQGHGPAMRLLGHVHHKGQIGVVRDPTEAMRWFAKGAKADDPESQFELGLGYFSGDGVTRSPSMTAWWWHKSALQGHVPSACNLGNLYSSGVGIAKDPEKAFLWTARAAQQGDVLAQYNLSIMYRTGEGAPQDDQERYRWLRSAAEGGHKPAYLELAALLHTNPKLRGDGPAGLHWLRKAAESGNKEAAVLLFMSHATNAEGAPDIVESYAWGLVAAQLTARLEGDEKGKSVLGMLALIHDSMTEAQHEQARALARKILHDMAGAGESA